MPRTRLLAAALAMACVAGGAYAQIGLGNIANQADNASKNFDIADKNHDGLLTKEEAQKGPVPFIRAHFDQIDKAKRGAVSKEDVKEYVRAMQQQKQKHAPAPAAAPAPASTSH
ncbi:EF-hand domain-containing protein [Dyella soli]|uniref:EF-hand domain-containing protein n=1 Tax=Dyella soli TaxID=522319 RepID=UPI00197AB921|nr:EF-hand domain-containing protein [Dyella soli]